MYFILWFSFFLLNADVYLQTVTESKANDCPRFDYEYKLLERLLRIEFAQRESDANMEQLLEKLQSLQTEAREGIQALKDNVHGHGSTYVRWGRTVCPGNGTEIIYKGIAAGSQNTQKGSAADFLCLTDEPIFATKYQGYDAITYITNAEYKLSTGDKVFSTVSPNDDPPCCVCRTFRTSTIMIPGRTNCYPGWTMEYSGYLMTGHYRHEGASNYVCVDSTPEATDEGSTETDGHLLYFIEVSCENHPCSHYDGNGIVTCVICSK